MGRKMNTAAAELGAAQDVNRDTEQNATLDTAQDSTRDATQNIAGIPDFPELALFLAKSYGQMLNDRDYLKSVIDAGVRPYTKEMAIQDLTAVSIDYESDRVQTSNISNVPERVAELLDSGYVKKMNRRLHREMAETVMDYAYICWKIEVVETAMRERMDKKERAIFERLFVRGKTYREICKAYKKGTMHNKQVVQLKRNCIQAIADHLKNVGCFSLYIKYMEELKKEYLREDEMQREKSEDKNAR